MNRKIAFLDEELEIYNLTEVPNEIIMLAYNASLGTKEPVSVQDLKEDKEKLSHFIALLNPTLDKKIAEEQKNLYFKKNIDKMQFLQDNASGVLKFSEMSAKIANIENGYYEEYKKLNALKKEFFSFWARINVFCDPKEMANFNTNQNLEIVAGKPTLVVLMASKEGGVKAKTIEKNIYSKEDKTFLDGIIDKLYLSAEEKE